MTCRGWKEAAGAVIGVSALAFTVACSGTPPASGAAAGAVTQQAAAAPQQAAVPTAGPPVVVSCEPHQRALVRPTVVNGAAVSQIECVSADPSSAQAQASTQPAAYAPTVPLRRVSQPVASDLPDAQVVPAADARAVRTRQVVYDRPARRSVAKSAIIIGSSTGAGAGVGAAIGGKKGALIGAVVGGGGAAIWDQITRRK